MTKLLADAVLDGPEGILDNSTRMVVCSAAPANFAGIAAVALADVIVDATDFTPGNGDVSGRKVTVGALLVTEVTPSQVLTSGNTVNVPAFDVEFADPT